MSEALKVFDGIVTKVSEHLRQQSVVKAPFSENRRFPTLPEPIQQQVIQKVRLQLEQMELINDQVEEFEKFNILCQHHHLKPVDPQIYAELTKEIAWEIIDFGINQVYRNQLVFKLGNYSIEEYETYGPWELFSRPKYVLPKLMEVTEKLKSSDKTIYLDEIKPYIIEEALSQEKAQFKLTHQFVSPLVDEKTGEHRAFLSVFKVEPVHQNEKVVLFN